MTNPELNKGALTTYQVYRELMSLRELIETRLDGVDKATELLHENMTRVPTEVDKAVSHLRDVHGEKFHSIAQQFSSSNLALDAALQSTKEAVAKSEGAMSKQIDSLNATISANAKASDDKNTDMKERLMLLEGRGLGKEVAITASQSSGHYIIAIVGLVLGSLVGVGGLIIAFMK